MLRWKVIVVTERLLFSLLHLESAFGEGAGVSGIDDIVMGRKVLKLPR